MDKQNYTYNTGGNKKNYTDSGVLQEILTFSHTLLHPLFEGPVVVFPPVFLKL